MNIRNAIRITLALLFLDTLESLLSKFIVIIMIILVYRLLFNSYLKNAKTWIMIYAELYIIFIYYWTAAPFEWLLPPIVFSVKSNRNQHPNPNANVWTAVLQ